MEIILKQDIAGVGFTNEIVTVKNGYARNYLIPKKFAALATPSAKKVLAENLKQKAHKEEKIRNEAQTLADALKDIVVKIGAKTASTGKIFGSVNTILVAEAIKEQFKYEIDRKKIIIKAGVIKEVGIYDAVISLHKDVKAEFKLEVIAE